MNLCCGFSAILMDDLRISSLMLMLGMFFDVIDGLVARLLKVQSRLGAELDSFADLVSFGLAPAYLYTQLVPSDRWFYYIPAFFILIGSTMRLAIFNLRPSASHFLGLPTPASAFFIIGIFIGVEYGSDFVQSLIGTPSIYILIPAVLMILNLSKIRMFSFKQMSINQGYRMFILISLATFVFLTIYNFKLSMPIAVILYVILSLIHSIKIQK